MENELDVERLPILHAKHLAEQLNDDEVTEFFNMQVTMNPRSRAYGRVVAAMFVFVPYLESRPQFIEPFVEHVYTASKNTFAGINDKASFLEFLDTKAVVDDKLRAAMQKHRALFEAAAERVAQPPT